MTAAPTPDDRPARLAEALGSALTDADGITVVVWTRDGRVVYANAPARESLGVARTDNRPLQELLPEVADDLLHHAETVFRRGVALEVDLYVTDSRGGPPDRLVTFLPLLDDDGVVRYVATVSHDLSAHRRERRRTQHPGEQRLKIEIEQARRAGAEYQRALLQYTQVVRHRIANPLSSVIGGLQTLLDRDLPRETQRDLLHSMLGSAHELHEIALEPRRRGPEERDLNALPADLEDHEIGAAVARAAGDVEADFRDFNEVLATEARDPDRPVRFMCECAMPDCTTPIPMTLRQYREAHRSGTRFVVAPEHNLAAVEDVVHRELKWWIVEKRGEAAAAARERA